MLSLMPYSSTAQEGVGEGCGGWLMVDKERVHANHAVTLKGNAPSVYAVVCILLTT